jgi:hypothetical protein
VKSGEVREMDSKKKVEDIGNEERRAKGMNVEG